VNPRASRPALLALIIACVVTAAGPSAFAQTLAPPPPPMEGVPDVPPSAPPDPDLDPQVTIIQKDQETVEEVRIAGELRFIRVTPLHGKSYYLIPDAGPNTFIRRDSLDSGLKVPLWVLYSW
jgi:hypothetical protein